MTEPIEPPKRTYALVPFELGEHVLICTECGRRIPAGYPFVAVDRDITRPDRLDEGQPVTDAICVYCDRLPE